VTLSTVTHNETIQYSSTVTADVQNVIDELEADYLIGQWP